MSHSTADIDEKKNHLSFAIKIISPSSSPFLAAELVMTKKKKTKKKKISFSLVRLMKQNFSFLHHQFRIQRNPSTIDHRDSSTQLDRMTFFNEMQNKDFLLLLLLLRQEITRFRDVMKRRQMSFESARTWRPRLTSVGRPTEIASRSEKKRFFSMKTKSSAKKKRFSSFEGQLKTFDL